MLATNHLGKQSGIDRIPGPDHHPVYGPHRSHGLDLIEGHCPGPEHGQSARIVDRQQRFLSDSVTALGSEPLV